MEQYRTEKRGNAVTVWDDTEGVGLRFIEGETLQRYTSEIVLLDPSKASTEEGVATIGRVSAALTRWAAERYPSEFDTIKTE